jgi:pimeloyl-ACP methyl ester carboxylesterase
LAFFRRIECPVLTVEGAQSQQRRRTDKQHRLEAMSRREHAVIDKAGHMVHQDSPAALARVIANFFARKEG